MVRATTGLPAVVVTVTVAERADAVVFDSADTANDASRVPEAGLTVSHEAFDDADHVVFDDTDTDVAPADADGTDHDDTPKARFGATTGAVAVTV